MAKTRVSELAKKYGIKSADALKMLNDIGEFAKTASSSIELPAVKKFEATYGAELLSKMKPGDAAAAEAPAKPAAPKPAPAKKAAPAPAPEAP
ncbi:translation initiation factor IF-2 N-terminal domain-containing protein, partial [Nocardioides ginsengisoli]|uniref:translation initiation factor IF-2 N-terminal domain-containing protein n=1 Tax=Nocardioides ginsengisoli TaxID=363868 RepID=UPI00349EB846